MSENSENVRRGSTGTCDVFISYASADRAIADAVCAALERAGIRCWIAPRDIVPGEVYASAIVHAIDGAKIMIVVLSQTAAASPHVVREIERAVSKRHALVSFRIETFSLPPALEYFLNTSHWLDATAAGAAAMLPTLIDAVRHVSASGSSAEALGAPANKSARAATTARAAGASNSIAVLPFANMSADPDQEYFSDGLAEEIINLLAHIPALKVIARTSAFAFRGKQQDIRAIADALGVSHVLEGSVRRAGNRLRITGQLIDAADGTHLWSERYDRELSDIFAIQDEIAAAIVDILRVKLSKRAGPQRYVPNLAAYEAHLKARYLVAKVTPESLEEARRCFERACELDTGFALPHIGLGHYSMSAVMFGRASAHDALPAARAQARLALQIDPSLPEAHALLGVLAAMYDFDWTTAERHFDFPLAKEASFATFRPMYGWFQFLRGNPLQAIDVTLHALEADPLDVWPRMNLHAHLQAAGRDAQAMEQLHKVLELDEHQVVALVSMAMLHAERGEQAQALATARHAHAAAPWYNDATAVLAALLRNNGDIAGSQSLVHTLGSGEAPGAAAVRALFHLLCGEVDAGADCAEQAIVQRDQSILVYLRFVAARQLRASHRWPKIAQLLNVPQ